jgi:hypothetical protein
MDNIVLKLQAYMNALRVANARNPPPSTTFHFETNIARSINDEVAAETLARDREDSAAKNPRSYRNVSTCYTADDCVLSRSSDEKHLQPP